jgi:chorismate mutase/prephenate dehydratase
MAKSTPDKKRPTRATTSVSKPADPKARLTRLDAQLVDLLQQRAVATTELAKASPDDAATPPTPEADDAMLRELAATKPGPLPESLVRAIMREVLSGCRALVRQTRIAFLGPLYSYSHVAAMHRFGLGGEYVPVGTIAAVFEEVELRHAQYGLVPIENSTDGRVADSLDVFTRVRVPVTGVVEMRIHHTLLAKCPRNEVREVYSKPQALSQCRNWLAKHLPAARTVEVTSTSTAAQLAREKPGAAAIASKLAGAHYGLDALSENIEDNPGNFTRFAVIGGTPPKRTGRDRTALWFQVEHRPGTLAEAMNIFRRNAVNLTWIESFPIPNSDRAYLFFVEMEGHQHDARVRKAVASLQRRALRTEILGSFPAPAIIE